MLCQDDDLLTSYNISNEGWLKEVDFQVSWAVHVHPWYDVHTENIGRKQAQVRLVGQQRP